MILRCRPWLLVDQSLKLYQPLRFFSKRNVVQNLSDRGMLADVFPKERVSSLVSLLESSPRTVYAGFDPTADSLHLGNLLVIMGLLQFQRSGHNIIALIGGATGRIGDPSGKSTERVMIESDILELNIRGIQRDLQQVFTNHSRHFWREEAAAGRLAEVEVVNNERWYRGVNIIEFITTVGRHFRVGKMIARHSVKSRLESEHGISFTEFAYQTFQANDWLRLYQEKSCLLQLGGSDQMGNIAAGQELISRVTDKQVFGVTLPLVVSDTGSKFGKSAGVPVWLSPTKTSPFQFYQYLLRVPDSGIEQLLRYFTFLPLGEIQRLMEKHRSQPERRLAQEKLATNVTLLVHGREGLDLAVRTTNILYNGDMATLGQLSLAETRAVFEQADYVQKLYSPGISVLDVCLKIGCFKTERDAVRIIAAGGVYINQQRVTNTEELIVHGVHIMSNSLMLVRVGKKNYYIVEWT